MTYVPKTEPWTHQTELFEQAKDVPAFAIFAEQRTGKTKPVIDIVSYRYEKGEVDALLIVALPSGVHRNWVTDEIPTHMPDRIPRMCVVWNASKSKTKAFKEELEKLLAFPGLAVLAANGEATITKDFEAYAVRFIKRRKVFFAADETTLIMKTPGAQRTKAMHAYGRMLQKAPGAPGVVVKMIMDGTPVGEGPFDLYSQVTFLTPKILGFTSFFAFKMRYGRWSKGYNGATGQEYPVLEEYQNLEELTEKLAPHSFRITRKQAFPNMPDQIICPVRFELSREQRRVYDALRDEYEAELRDGTQVTSQHVLTRLLRLQQVSSGMWPSEKAYSMCGECGGSGCEVCDRIGAIEVVVPAKVIDPANDPRLEALEDQLTRTNEPFIVWSRFISDVDKCMALCAKMGRSPVRYDGQVSSDQKAENKLAFQTGKAGAMIGNPTSGGRGLTLKAAKTIYNYSHFFSLLTYLQGNDRAEDPFASRGTAIVNLLALDTVDEDIDEAHAAKKSVADLIVDRKRAGGRAF